jgi:hypothetical protein
MARKADPATRTICLTVDHVHLPADPLAPDWQTATDTARYSAKVDGKRVRYEVHAALADFLIDRDQAIEVPAERTED